MVGETGSDFANDTPIDNVRRLVSDIERLRGELRISIRETDDGLGIHIPPSRKIFIVIFLAFWLCGWAVGEYFALSELFSRGFSAPDLFLLIWVIPWTIGGAGVFWTILWQLFGVERLFFTADTLVREWGLLSVRGRRVLAGTDILEVKVDNSTGNDMAGMGTIKVTTSTRPMRIGNGLDSYEAELVAKIIREAAAAR